MQKKFSEKIVRNVEQTYTYRLSKHLGYYFSIQEFKPMTLFLEELKKDPFIAFMRLDGYAFKRTQQTLDRYGIPYTKLQEKRAKFYNDVTEKMDTVKQDLVSEARFEEIPDVEGTEVVRINRGFTIRQTVSMHRKLNALPVDRQTDNVLVESELSDTVKNQKEQVAAIEMCLKNHVSCLIGGAGTGKSYVTAQIIKQLQANKKSVVVLAPTHKAKEALQEKIGKMAQVRTIHSYAYSYDEGSKTDAIVVDECGMLSTILCDKLLNKHTTEQLIFVGDKNQLAPIGPGRPFEKIQKRFPCFELKKNRRSEAPDIVTLGKMILGEPVNENIELPNIEVVSSIKEAFQRGAEVVLTHTNKNVAAINEFKRIKNGKPAIAEGFSVGDKVVATDTGKGYYNGQLFEIVKYNMLQDSKGRTVTLRTDKDLSWQFKLAYGLTIHKSQGSEWDVVAYQPSDTDTKRLAYVAVTRAKQKIIIIGNLKDEYADEKEWEQLN